MDQLAYWIGWTLISMGGTMLALAALACIAWGTNEIVWRQIGDWQTLCDYMRWKQVQKKADIP